jgi:hypothetical protein
MAHISKFDEQSTSCTTVLSLSTLVYNGIIFGVYLASSFSTSTIGTTAVEGCNSLDGVLFFEELAYHSTRFSEVEVLTSDLGDMDALVLSRNLVSLTVLKYVFDGLEEITILIKHSQG